MLAASASARVANTGGMELSTYTRMKLIEKEKLNFEKKFKNKPEQSIMEIADPFFKVDKPEEFN